MRSFTEFDEIQNDFLNYNGEFTIFLVEPDYYRNKGNHYLMQFLGTEHWFSSDEKCRIKINEILFWLEKNNNNINELIEELRDISENQNHLTDNAVTILTKLYSVTSHKLPIAETLNPIIIEESSISKKNISLLVSLNKYCNYTPTIIVILKDNNFERAEKVFLQCPNDTNLKILKNNGETIYRKVVNEGADTIEQFLEFFSKQCFSTCSKTENNILFSDEWSKNSVISEFSPSIFKIRSIFVTEHKLVAKQDIKNLDTKLDTYNINTVDNEILLNSLVCMNKLFNVYCNDYGGKDLDTAWDIAKNLDNEILLAHVYRYSHFFNCSRTDKQGFLSEAEKIFSKYGINDHAIYCENNRLIHQFSMDKISINDFSNLENTCNNMPELALKAHILNNIGVAYLFDRLTNKAIDTLNDGLEYTGNNHIQRLALKSNLLIAIFIATGKYDEVSAKNILDEIFTPYLGLNRMTFLTAQFALNVIGVVVNNNINLSKNLIAEYNIIQLIQTAFSTNIMGAGSMIKQMQAIAAKHPQLDLIKHIKLPSKTTNILGIRLDFIEKYALNPFFFNTWL